MDTKEEKLRFYASAPRASARQIHKIVDGNFKVFWLAMLKGEAVTLESGNHKFNTREEAVHHARLFRASCRKELAALECTDD